MTPGTRLGPYEVIAPLGAGGMGEVYRAHDTKLNREVALKILPEAVANDPDRLARFTREAQTLAALNHPNIGAIYGIEESSSVRALVMELIEGDDLSVLIARGSMSLDELLPIARQIAEALEAAHEHGIIHRDLKPANIKVRSDGTVKVLDFGLAKALDPPAGTAAGAASANSPTLTSPAMMTGIGVILGTAAYMSPEQAKGRPADKRSDVWAFGCVFFEMLTGRRAFDGDDMTEVLGAVVRLEPRWEELSPELPPPIRTLLHSCLIKDRRHRVADISTALFVIDKVATLGASETSAVVAPPAQRPLWRRLIAPAVAAMAGAAIVGPAAWFAARQDDPDTPQVSRLTMSTSGGAQVAFNGNNLAITPDGSRVIYVGNRGTELFVRALDALEPVLVSTGGSLRGPFVSPNGEWIGFTDGGVLKRVAVTGGPTLTVATLDQAARGATWSDDNAIIAATSSRTTGLLRIAVADGATTVVTRPDHAQGDADHLWPEALPEGRGVLFTIMALTGGLDAAQVAVLDLRTGAHSIVVRGARHARYVPSGLDSGANGERESGHLVYTSGGALHAVPFDLVTLKTVGPPVSIVPDVVGTQFGAVDTVVASNGTLAYIDGGDAYGALSRRRTMVWVDRQGRESPIPAPPRSYVYPRLSPDGKRIAVIAVDFDVDVWLWELGRGPLTRATFDPAADHAPVWTPDSRRLIFSSDRLGGTRSLFAQMANGTSEVVQLAHSQNRQSATAVTPDGGNVIVMETGRKTAEDVMQVALDGTGRVTALVQTSFVERNGVVSPDGKWLAYEANDSGRFEISVVPYPDVQSGRWQVTSTGGTRPLWSRNGKELFYVASTDALMRIGMEGGPATATTPTQLIGEGYLTAPPIDVGRSYDVSLDGQRFLMIKAPAGSGPAAASRGIIVVQHWREELRRLVPRK